MQFSDPIKPDIALVVEKLKKQGVQLKIITGDHHSVALHVASVMGVTKASMLTGAELHSISDHALIKIASEKNIFAEIEPNQKERIILALRKVGAMLSAI